MSFRSSTSSFRRSILLCALLLLLASWGFERSSVVPISYFGGSKLAAKYTQLHALDESANVQIIAMGPSYVDNGFDARLFTELTGKTTYNLGLPSTGIYTQSILIRHLLIPLFEPEAIVWGIGEAATIRSGINRQYLASPALERARWPLGAWVCELERRLPHLQKRRVREWLAILEEPPEGRMDGFGDTKKTLRWEEVAHIKRERQDAFLERMDDEADLQEDQEDKGGDEELEAADSRRKRLRSLRPASTTLVSRGRQTSSGCWQRRTWSVATWNVAGSRPKRPSGSLRHVEPAGGRSAPSEPLRVL